MANTEKTFREWMLEKHLDKDTPFGDLADDMADDEEWPAKNEREVILRYLERQHACTACLETFGCAWAAYRRYVKKETGGDA